MTCTKKHGSRVCGNPVVQGKWCEGCKEAKRQENRVAVIKRGGRPRICAACGCNRFTQAPA